MLWNEPESVLVFQNSQQTGHDFLITGGGRISPKLEKWIDITGASYQEQRNLTPDHLHHALRVGYIAAGPRIPELTKQIASQVGDKAIVHSFQAMHVDEPTQAVYLFEAFAAGVNKWRGIQTIANELNIPTKRIACIGDEVNDLAMLENAGCAIVMDNGIDEAKARAQHITKSNREDGVAYAIEKLLNETW